MEYCGACGTENTENSNYCLNCGTTIVKSINKQPEARRPPIGNKRSTSYPQDVPFYHVKQEDELPSIAYVCACCVPLAGFVIWGIIRDERPESANSVLIISIVSLVVSFLFGIVN